MTEQEQRLLEVTGRLLPPPDLTVSQWADRYRQLSREASAEYGQWSTDRVPYLREPMDALTQRRGNQVVLMFGAQCGKTECQLNFLAYIIDVDPGPILMVQPRESDAKTVSKDRIAPMLRDSPRLRDKIGRLKVRDSDNTTVRKVFIGGQLSLTGAQKPAGLAGRPIRYLLPDEIDRYPESAGSEGDPLSIARMRTSNFWNSMTLMASTPTITGLRIHREFLGGTQEYYWVGCPHCKALQVLEWERIEWDEGAPLTAKYRCGTCETLIDHRHKTEMLANGQWIARRPDALYRSFTISGLYSPWKTWGARAAQYLEACKSPETKRVFYNTVLAMPWEEHAAIRLDEDVLLARRYAYGPEVPRGVALITAGVDVQANRLEIEFVGWGRDEENWGLGRRVLPGDPTRSEVWRDLDALLKQEFVNEDGIPLYTGAACVDSSYATNHVYRFTRERLGRYIYAVKGRDGKLPIWPLKLSKARRSRAIVFMVGVDAAKQRIMTQLAIETMGPGFCHFTVAPEAFYDLDFFEQITSERPFVKFRKGNREIEWRKDPSRRNEGLDCRVYAYAALYSWLGRGKNLNQEAARIEKLGQCEKEVRAEMRRVGVDLAAPQPRRTGPSAIGGFSI